MKLSFEDALILARGCLDYGGGYRSNKGEFEIYQNGIWTVINVLEKALENSNKDVNDTQLNALYKIGENKGN